MNDSRRTVVIGDPNSKRFNWLMALLIEEFDLDVIRATTFDEIKNVAHTRSIDSCPRVIFLSDDLPYSLNVPKRDPRINFLKLEEYFYEADFVCIVTKEEEPELDGVTKRPHHVHIRGIPETAEQRSRIMVELGGLGRGLLVSNEAIAVQKILDWDTSNRVLRKQICSLSESFDLDNGEIQLCRLIGKSINYADCHKIEVKQLTQGSSGAIVFHLISHSDEPQEYVIKISPGKTLWKLEAEVCGHLDAQKHSGFPGYKQHVAILKTPNKPPLMDSKAERRFIVSSGRWYAIHYDFLGGPSFGKFIDLETELTAGPDTLIRRTVGSEKFSLTSDTRDEVFAHRLRVFEAALDGLCDIWYGKDELCTRREETIWRLSDAPERALISLPPYQLTKRAKGWAQDFLDSREASLGPRLLADWADHSGRIVELVNDGAGAIKDADRTTTFTLSPVHGDLNAANILLWLNYDRYPFLIDLPFFQKHGHALQDFARLEVELKFALMDRQEETPVRQLAGFDHTATQMPVWIEMENHLLTEDALLAAKLLDPAGTRTQFTAEGYQDNVELCYRIIMMLRRKACSIQQRTIPGALAAGLFKDEYLPALLYHSVRAIGYPSLSLFKRLLAVYSSSAILQHW